MANDKISTAVLACGLRVAFKRTFSDVAYCAITIRSGTRDEEKPGSGIAHFTEHLLFKGTEKKSAQAINNYLERSGGELNAFTTKEETVIHATLLKEELSKGISLLLELAYKSLFRENDINTEKNVIIDEIQSYKDSPPDAIYDHFEELLLKGTPLAPQILGSIRNVRTAKRKDIEKYVKDNFRSDRSVLSIVADIDEKLLMRKIAKAASGLGIDGSIASNSRPTASPYPLARGLKEGERFDISINKRNHQANCIIGCTGYPIGDERQRIALVLICNILGGPAASSLLNTELREKRGWVYGVDMTYTPYADNGVVAVSFGCDKEKIGCCCDAVMAILKRFREKPLNDTALKAAKKQLKGQLLISSDNGEQRCLAIGKNFLLSGTSADETRGQKILESLTAGEVAECAREILAEERISRLIYI